MPGESHFYSKGLKFSCLRCSFCCRHESGYVYLSQKDLLLLCSHLKTDYSTFISQYCRWVGTGFGKKKLSLKEKANFDCIFWSNDDNLKGCSVYNARPLQCRSYPFWSFVLASPAAWKNASKDCPGMNQGEIHSEKTINAWLKESEEEDIISSHDKPDNGS